MSKTHLCVKQPDLLNSGNILRFFACRLILRQPLAEAKETGSQREISGCLAVGLSLSPFN